MSEITLEEITNTLPASKPRPVITCADGFTVSVQASWGHYAHDFDGRRPFAHEDTVLPWTRVEVGYPSARPEPWGQWALLADDPSDFSCIYGYVPVSMVRRLIAFHGGEAKPAALDPLNAAATAYRQARADVDTARERMTADPETRAAYRAALRALADATNRLTRAANGG